MARPRGHGDEVLPPDNAARIVLYDALAAADEAGTSALDDRSLFERVIPRLRVLVPRELHLHGEQPYVASKVMGCVAAGILQRSGGGQVLRLGVERPRVRYPDGTIRPYDAGLEAARERLDADEGRLRRGGFDVRHVRQVIGSIADDRKADRYRSLVSSLREHGLLFLDCRRIVESRNGSVVDGIARKAAAAEVGLTLKKQHVMTLPSMRDTPLQVALLVLDLNAERLSDKDRDKVREVIAARAQRPWYEVESDLNLTRDWRVAEPKDYDAKFNVSLVAFRPGGEATVQMTDHDLTRRVLLRSLTKAAGLPEWSRDHILPFVPHEDARTPHTGRKGIFVRVDDLGAGIEEMKTKRSSQGLKVDKAWDDVQSWLTDQLRPPAPPVDSPPRNRPN